MTTKNRLGHVSVLELFDSGWPEGDTGAGIDKATKQDDIGFSRLREKRGDGQAIGDDLDGSADEQLGQFESGGTAIKQDRGAIGNALVHGLGNQPFFDDSGGNPVFEGRQTIADGGGIDLGSAMRAFELSLLIPELKITA